MERVLAQEVFSVFGIPIYDTVLSTWVMMLIIIGGVVVVRHRFPLALERLVDFLRGMISDVMGRPAEPYLPFLGALVIFICVANVIGVVPVITTPTKDINTTAALALAVFVAVHVYGIREKGVWLHLKDMASPLGLAVLMLPLELLGQSSRTFALALRLFGNVISSELIVDVIFNMVPVLAPLPMMALGLFTGVLQAYIFTILAAVFIGMAVKTDE
jgi:F-type H+-transporting ATPase subunit a